MFKIVYYKQKIILAGFRPPHGLVCLGQQRPLFPCCKPEFARRRCPIDGFARPPLRRLIYHRHCRHVEEDEHARRRHGERGPVGNHKRHPASRLYRGAQALPRLHWPAAHEPRLVRKPLARPGDAGRLCRHGPSDSGEGQPLRRNHLSLGVQRLHRRPGLLYGAKHEALPPHPHLRRAARRLRLPPLPPLLHREGIPQALDARAHVADYRCR